VPKEIDWIANEFARLCVRAAVDVMEVYSSEFTAEQKADKSPVTKADTRAEAVILKGLETLLPGIPVLAEESFSRGVRPNVDRMFVLVDPVDGTKEFISKNGEFTVNIALIDGRRPVAGCVYAPALERLYSGASSALAGYVPPGDTNALSSLTPIRVRQWPAAGPTAVMSRSHADETTKTWAEQAGVIDTIPAGSSLKFCLLAEGRADLYPRFGPTMEWDTAAGHAVLAAAGGHVTDPEGADFLYGKSDAGYRNGPFIAKTQR
jgi:3'(2'), 5'-bisphosphate nucleotidase